MIMYLNLFVFVIIFIFVLHIIWWGLINILGTGVFSDVLF